MFIYHFRDSYKNFLENVDHYRTISKQRDIRKTINDDIFELIQSTEFKRKVQREVDIQDPICELINKCQKFTTNLAEGAEQWLNIRPPQNASSLQKTKFEERQEMALNGIALAAYYLDPYKDRSKLSTEQISEARHYINSVTSGDITGELYEYENLNEELTHLKCKVDNALDFFTCSRGVLPQLSIIGTRLSRIPCSSAQLERIFSMWQHVHTKARNRLTFERSKKLLHIYVYLKTTDQTFLDSMDDD